VRPALRLLVLAALAVGAIVLSLRLGAVRLGTREVV
jgi:hypothetical protein